MKITIVNRSKRSVPHAFLERWVRDVARAMLREPRLKKFKRQLQSDLVLAFVDAAEMKKLNEEFRHKNYATDVLSFESMEDGVLGELVICPHVISRQAREHGLLVREELGYMVLHGMLHLLGFDHEKSARAEREMLTLQDRLFEKLIDS